MKTPIQTIATLAKSMGASPKILEAVVKKTRELEKQFGIDDENLEQQLCGYIMYQNNCDGVNEIKSLFHFGSPFTE